MALDRLPLVLPGCALALETEEDVLLRELAEPITSRVLPGSRASKSDGGRRMEASPPRRVPRDMFNVDEEFMQPHMSLMALPLDSERVSYVFGVGRERQTGLT